MTSPGPKNPLRLILPGSVIAEIIAAARGEAPAEACGLLVGKTAAGGTEVVRAGAARNLDPRPNRRFHLAPRDFLAAERDARAEGIEVVGFWHSHPVSAAVPSSADRDAAWEGYSYLIVSLAADRPRLRSWRFDARRPVEEEVIDGSVAGSEATA